MTPGGDKLGAWVLYQRQNKNDLSPDRQARLEALKSWIWDVREALWEEGFASLQQFAATNGHVNVPRSYTTSKGQKLRSWVLNQRTRRGRLSPEQKSRLEALPGWVWAVHEAAWEEGFKQLEQYAKTHGHARVPEGLSTPGENCSFVAPENCTPSDAGDEPQTVVSSFRARRFDVVGALVLCGLIARSRSVCSRIR